MLVVKGYILQFQSKHFVGFRILVMLKDHMKHMLWLVFFVE